MKQFLILGFLALTLAACASVDTLARGSGKNFTVSAASYAAVYKAATDTLGEQGLSIVSSSKETGEIRAKSGISAFSWGEYVGIFISKETRSGRTYSVEIQSEKALSGNVTATDWTKALIEGIRTKLAQ